MGFRGKIQGGYKSLGGGCQETREMNGIEGPVSTVEAT